MRVSNLYAVLAGLALAVGAVTPQKQVLITYPADTPESTLSQARTSIESAVSISHLPVLAVLTLSQPGWSDTTRIWYGS